MERLLVALGLLGRRDTLTATLSSLFSVASWKDIQTLVDSLLLSEVVYKAVGESPEVALRALNLFAQQFRDLEGLPPGLPSLRSVQFSLSHVGHRYMLGRGPGALYVCFAGTKELRDYMTDANLLQQELWRGGALGAAALRDSRVHRGFLSRSEGVPIESLYMHARRQGLRLVLCGHSLGGAVAALCTLRLLATLRQAPPPSLLRCLTFGSPAIGNEALAAHVHQEGWDRYFWSFSLPEDPVPRLFLFRPAPVPASLPSGLPNSTPGAPSTHSIVQQGSSDGEVPHTGPGPPTSATGGLRQPSSLASPRRATLAGGMPPEGGPASTAQQQAALVLEDEAAGAELGSSSAAGGPSAGPGRLAWATGRLAAAASTATTGASRLIPSYPSFTHFGQQRYLLPTHVASYPPAMPIPATISPAAASAAHRMLAYRGRILSICRHAVHSRQQAQQGDGMARAAAKWLRRRLAPQQGQQAQQHAAIEMAQLAPPVAVQAAVACLPPLPSPSWQGGSGKAEPEGTLSMALPSTLGQAAPGPGSGVGSTNSPPSNGAAASRETSVGGAPAQDPPSKWGLLRLPRPALALRPHPPTNREAVGAAGASSRAMELSTPMLPAQLPLTVAVYGTGIENCTAASLQLPSGSSVEAVRLENRAGRLLAGALAAKAAGDGEVKRQGASSLAARTLQELRSSWGAHQQVHAAGGGGLKPAEASSTFFPRGHASSSASGAAVAGLELEFVLSPSLLVQLQQAAQQMTLQQRGRPRPKKAPLSLHLLTDFGSHTAPVEVQAQVVWLLGPEPALCQDLFQELVRASELQAAAVASLHPSRPRGWLGPLRGPAGVSRMAAVAGAWVGRRARVGRGLDGPADGGSKGASKFTNRQLERAEGPVAGLLNQAKAAAVQQGSLPQPARLPQPSAGRAHPWMAAAAARLRHASTLLPPLPRAAGVPRVLAQGLCLVDASNAALGNSAPNPAATTGASAAAPIAKAGKAGPAEAGNDGLPPQQLMESARRLGIVAAVLNKKGLQRVEEWRRAGRAGGVDKEDLLAELAEAEVPDEDFALEHRLSTGAKLRHRVSQASRAARHRALLLRRWPALRDAPHPDIALLVLPRSLFSQSWLLGPLHSPPLEVNGSGRSLESTSSTSNGSGYAPSGNSSRSSPPSARQEAALLELLSELQRVVALAQALGVPVLLALVGQAGFPLPLSELARRRIAASIGLDGGLEAVVPVPVECGDGGKGRGGRLQVGALQAALHACAAGQGRDAGEEPWRGVRGLLQARQPWRSRL